MTQEPALERSGIDMSDAPERASGRRREAKHPASEVRRLIVSAAKALPADRPLWFRKLSHPRWSR
jgi:hypothetical protein